MFGLGGMEVDVTRYEGGNKGWNALALQQMSIYMSPALVTRGSDLWEHVQWLFP